jgi:antitoxin HigA-1
MAREYPVMREPRRPPTHPAALLREDVLPALDLSVAQVARDLGVTRQTLHRLLAEKIGVSPEMAVRLGKFCGNGPDLWLRMQAAHDIWHAERKMKAQIARIPTRRAEKAAA